MLQAAPSILQGVGIPEGFASASDGSAYIQRRGESHRLWQKQSPGGPTGWVTLGDSLRLVNVRDAGAIGDAIRDDTVAFQRAVTSLGAAGGIVYVPKGRYLIDPNYKEHGSIRLGSNVHLIMEPTAELHATPNGLTHYAVVMADGAENVSVIGGLIIGERGQHRGSSGEWGMGVWLRSCAGAHISATHISECWGDGIFLDQARPGGECSDIDIRSVTCEHNRRQGISVVAAQRVRVSSSAFLDTAGTAPSAGVDCEPEPGGGRVRDVDISGCVFERNTYGVLITTTAERCRVSKSRLTGNTSGVMLAGDCRAPALEDLEIKCTDPSHVGVHLSFIAGARLADVRISGTFKYGIWAQASPNTGNGHHRIDRCEVHGDGVNGVGLYLTNGCDWTQISGCTIEGVQSAVYATASDHGVLLRNTIRGTKQHAVTVNGGKFWDLSRNQVQHAGGQGVALSSVQRAVVTANLITESALEGLELRKCADCEAIANVSMGNRAGMDVHVIDALRCDVRENTVSAPGIALADAPRIWRERERIRGDEDVVLRSTDPVVETFSAPLKSDRSVTLPDAGSVVGHRLRVVRTAGGPGALLVRGFELMSLRHCAIVDFDATATGWIMVRQTPLECT
jgi:nitrous oxidase accessory protein NosD